MPSVHHVNRIRFACCMLYLLIADVCVETNVYPEMVCIPLDPSLADAVRSDVKYRFFNDPRDERGFYYTEDNIEDGMFNRSWSTKFIIHGWTTDENSVWYKPMKDAYFGRKREYNIVYIDWSVAGNKSYPVSAANTVPVGRFMADFIVKSGLHLDKVHLIGHSLGSQLASSVGKGIKEQTGKKIYRITATDPARPMFESLPNSDYRLDKDDATFVDVVHTDIGHYGLTIAVGHVDYYPNGGKDQPGCPPLEEDETSPHFNDSKPIDHSTKNPCKHFKNVSSSTLNLLGDASNFKMLLSIFKFDNCSHAKSNKLYIQSILGTKYKARLADSWEDYLEGNYLSEKQFLFGEYISQDSRGKLYFKSD